MIFFHSFRRSWRYSLLRVAVIVFLAWNFLDVLRVRWSILLAQNASEAEGTFGEQKVYISSIHWNNEQIIRSHWNSAVVNLIKALGPENVYVSVYESGSWDDSKGALRELDTELAHLGVRKTIVLDETTHLDEIQKEPAASGWIDTPRGKKELRRIPYLAKLRNLSIKPLEQLQSSGEHFDKVLFLNDIVFLVRRADGSHSGCA